MILGIDPKNDYAFKRVFGSEEHAAILIDLLNAVLDPPPGGRVVAVQILNPLSDPAALDDKLAILDILARDQQGRLFNVEMQTALHLAVGERFLYYWADAFRGQLRSGDGYEMLRPVISICFLDGWMFPESDLWHLPFELWCPPAGIRYSDTLALHIFQLPNFKKTPEELATPIDRWLYFLKHGEDLDPEALPPTLQVDEVQAAMGALRMLTLDERERQQYENWERARRDALERKREYERLKEEAARSWAAGRDEGREEGLRVGLIAQVRLLETVLQREETPEDQLQSRSTDELQALIADLRQALGRH